MNEKKTVKEDSTKQEKYTSCGEILSIFASHANTNIFSVQKKSFDLMILLDVFSKF